MSADSQETHDAHIDHLVLTAPSLEAGEELVRRTLGADMTRGGEHALMGTHNSLLRLGAALYLEVIAVNRVALPPNRPRWFGLDRLGAGGPARLTTWVARTNDIHAAVAASPLPLGRIEAMTRGSLRWLVTIPEDGSVPADGVAPTLIQWLEGPHPASRLADSGCSLVRLEGLHPEPDRIDAMLDAVRFTGPFTLSPLAARESASLIAHIRTPYGTRRLGSLDA